ncbi:MAG: hypothetical protein ACK5K7_03930 [Bacilli bacterium]
MKTHKGVFGLLIVVMILSFFIAPNNEIMFPALVVDKYGFTESVYGLSITILLVGNICASSLLARVKKINETALKTLFIIESTVLVGMGISANLLYNISNTIFLVIYLTLMFIVGF